MKKILLAVTALFFSSSVIMAQEEAKTSEAKDSKFFTVSLLLGNSQFLDSGSTILNYNNTIVDGGSPYNTAINNTDNDLTNMIGVEGKFFVKNTMAITLTGGLSFRNSPSYYDIPAVTGSNGTIIPAYTAVLGEDDLDVHFAPGLQFYLNYKKSKRLLPYVGFAIPVDYSRYSVFDPSSDVDVTNVANLGVNHVELFGLGVQGIAGIDYYLTKNLFVGFDFKPVTFSYLVSTKSPGQGTVAREADNMSFSLFSSYVFKLGFRL